MLFLNIYIDTVCTVHPFGIPLEPDGKFAFSALTNVPVSETPFNQSIKVKDDVAPDGKLDAKHLT